MRNCLPKIALLACASLFAFSRSALADSPEKKEPEAAGAPSDNVLVPPELVTFSEAEYPAEALAQKKTADVVLLLSIDAEGKVQEAKVEELAGLGFDEAAQRAALKFVFRPATRKGTPIPARILYRYSFTLKEVEVAAPANQPPPPSRLVGRLRVGDTEEPLAGASVVLKLADGRTLETTTDEAGAFGLTDLPSGRAIVTVKAPGFAPWEGEESLSAGEGIEVLYRLRPPSDAIEVTVRGERPDREVTKRTLERKELALVPGTGGDALKALQSLPSVARPPGMMGLLIVRGSGPRGTHTFVDGTFVPMIYHFGGLTSVVPTEMIEAIDFYPGNFSAKYGRVTGGIVDVRLREMEQDGKYHGLGQVDLIDARVMLRGPVPLLPGWNFQIAGRRSHMDAWLGPVLEGSTGVRTSPVYYDWQGVVETKPTSQSLFRMSVYGSDDRLAFVLKDAMAGEPGMGNSLSLESRFLRVQAMYKNKISDALFMSATAAVGSDGEREKFGAFSIVGDYIPVTARGEIAWKPLEQLTFRAGPDIIYYHAKANIRATQPPDPGTPEPGPYSTQPLLTLERTTDLSQPAAFAEMEWLPISRAKLLLGARADYMNKTERWDFSPRANARYDIMQGFPRTTVKAGAGLFYEPPEPVQVVEVFGTKGLHSNRSVHYSAGLEQELSRAVEVSVEGFYKDMSDLVVRSPARDGSLGYKNVGDGKVVGVEALVRWKPIDRFFGWAAYTLSRSTRHNAPGEPERLFEYDQTHILTVLGSYDLGRGWQVGGRFRYVSGNPYTPCLSGVQQGGAGVYVCRSGELYSDRMPAFNQLDVRVDKTWKFRDFRLTTYLDVQNVYNRGNTEAVSYNYNYTKPTYQTGLPIIPSLGLKGEF